MRRLVLIPVLLVINTGCEELVQIAQDMEQAGDEIEEAFDGAKARKRIYLEETSGVSYGCNNNVWAGMTGVTCTFSANSGDMRRDVDLARGKERVIDADPEEDKVMIGTPDDNPHRPGGFKVVPVNPDTVAGQFTRDGMVRLVDGPAGCTLQFEGAHGHTGKEVSTRACAWPSLAVDRSTATTWLADGHITRHDADGGQEVVARGDLVAVDPDADIVYSAEPTVVRAHSTDGIELWTAETDGMVDAIAAMPFNNTVVVHVRQPGGSGELIFLDQDSGSMMAREGVPEAYADRIETDPDRPSLLIDLGDNGVVYNLKMLFASSN